jgi:hypothetical protein
MLKKIKDFTKNKDVVVEKFKQFSIWHIAFAFLFLIFIYIIIWTVIAKKSSSTIIGQIDAMRDKKINIALDDYNVAGFPFSFGTILDAVIYQNNNRSFAWQTDKIIIKTPLSNTNKIMINIPNEQFFLRNDLSNDPINNDKKNIRKIGINSQICKAELLYKAKNLHNIHLKSSNGVVKFLASNQTYQYNMFDFNMKEAQIIIDDTIENILEMNINIDNIQPPALWKAILEYNFSSLNATIYMRNPSSLNEIPDFYKFIMRQYDPPEIIIDTMVLMHPLSKISLKGLVSFNAQMQLNGNAVVTISDYQKLLKYLTKKGVITPAIASNFRFMFSFLLTTKTLEKNNGTVDVDLTIKNNIVYQGDVKLFEINL